MNTNETCKTIQEWIDEEEVTLGETKLERIDEGFIFTPFFFSSNSFSDRGQSFSGKGNWYGKDENGNAEIWGEDVLFSICREPEEMIDLWQWACLRLAPNSDMKQVVTSEYFYPSESQLKKHSNLVGICRLDYTKITIPTKGTCWENWKSVDRIAEAIESGLQILRGKQK